MDRIEAITQHPSAFRVPKLAAYLAHQTTLPPSIAIQAMSLGKELQPREAAAYVPDDLDPPRAEGIDPTEIFAKRKAESMAHEPSA